MMLRYFYITGSVIFLFACANKETSLLVTEAETKWVNESVGKELSKAEYNSWISSEANPMLFRKKIGKTEYALRYLPADFLAMREAGKIADDSLVAEAKEHYEDMVYFQMKITIPGVSYEPLKHDLPAGAEKGAEYDRRVKYCSFGMQNDISLVSEKKDTIPCSIMLYERSFDVAPVCNFQLAFNRTEIDRVTGNLSFVFYDNLFNQGIIKFTFRKEDLNKVPKLNVS